MMDKNEVEFTTKHVQLRNLWHFQISKSIEKPTCNANSGEKRAREEEEEEEEDEAELILEKHDSQVW